MAERTSARLNTGWDGERLPPTVARGHNSGRGYRAASTWLTNGRSCFLRLTTFLS